MPPPDAPAGEPPHPGDEAGRESHAWVCQACGYVLRYLAPVRRAQVGGCLHCGGSAVRPLEPRRPPATPS